MYVDHSSNTLIYSGTTCAEVKALNLLLEHSLWSSVLDLLNRLYNEVYTCIITLM